MSELLLDFRASRWWWSFRRVSLHVAIAALAIGIAFALPTAVQYALYRWWPLGVSDANLLLAAEICLAVSLALLFNFWRVAARGKAADTASLIYALHRASRLSRRRERSLITRLPAARDACILALTGSEILARENSPLREALQSADEIRVMLRHPAACGARKLVPPELVTRQSCFDEVEASIAYLAALRAPGRRVTLKFYEEEPFWKLVVLGDHLWVQYCRDGGEARDEPEYVFALNPGKPRLGLFAPFYVHFLERWNDARHPRYDFDTRELVYRDERSREVRRVRFSGAGADTPALLQPQARAAA